MTAKLQILEKDGAVVGELPQLSDAELLELYQHMLRIRVLDGRMLKLQRAGRIGFVGTSTGLEASLVGAAAALRPNDWMWSGLREGSCRSAACRSRSTSRRCTATPTTPRRGARCAPLPAQGV